MCDAMFYVLTMQLWKKTIYRITGSCCNKIIKVVSCFIFNIWGGSWVSVTVLGWSFTFLSVLPTVALPSEQFCLTSKCPWPRGTQMSIKPRENQDTQRTLWQHLIQPYFTKTGENKGYRIFPDNFAPCVTHGASPCLASLLTHPRKAEPFPETRRFNQPRNLWGVPAVNQESDLWGSNHSRETQLARQR